MSVRNYTLRDIGALIAQYRWLVLIPFALGAAAAPLLARYAPERYRSEALLLVIPQQVPKDYVTPTMSESIDERLPAITDQILSRSRLEQIIQDLDLYPRERASQVMEDVVQRMRLDVQTSAVGKKDVNSFRISYVSDNAEKARKVTERLASLYIEQNVKDRENQADSTSQFLTTQLEQAKQRLIDQEKKLEEYRKNHAGQLPSQLQGNLQSIQTASLQLQSLNESTNRAQERRLLIERQIADLKVVGTPAPASPQDTAPVGTAQQLEVAKARLALMLQRYTPSHPEVVSLERTIADLSAKLQSETPVGGAPEEPKKAVTPAEAEQQKRILDLQAELAVIDYQLAANRTQAAKLNQSIVDYQAKIDVVPTRESELVELTRDYGTMQAAYTNLLVKREEAMLAANLERRQIGEQFKLLDTASKPEKPYNQQQRIAIMSAGAAGGIVIGLLLIGFVELRDSSFKTEAEAVKALAVPVFAQIPMMLSDQERRAGRRRRWLIDGGGTAVLVACAAVLIVWRLRF